MSPPATAVLLGELPRESHLRRLFDLLEDDGLLDALVDDGRSYYVVLLHLVDACFRLAYAYGPVDYPQEPVFLAFGERMLAGGVQHIDEFDFGVTLARLAYLWDGGPGLSRHEPADSESSPGATRFHWRIIERMRAALWEHGRTPEQRHRLVATPPAEAPVPVNRAMRFVRWKLVGADAEKPEHRPRVHVIVAAPGDP